ncbi:uncharacterized protein LOC142163936 [Nicotiana tabacum]|uniref:Uncharacterized protein LOC142163936 n=1 Tax=Nicotiana tabacum TaxID=4097 RepID=A0AC58RWR1_TOBAC
MAVDMNINELLVIGDSDLLIHQVQGEWTTKNVKILPYLHSVKELCKKFIKIEFRNIIRIQNEFADALATLSSMIQHPKKSYIDPIEVEIQDQHAYCFHVDEEIDGKPWEVLYRRTLDLGLLRCVDVVEATILFEEIHAGTCGPHMNDFTLAMKTLRAGYFWLTMERDNILYVQKCHQCHNHEDFIRVPPNELKVMGSPWTLAAWGMDVIGSIEPPPSNIHHFILVAIVITKKEQLMLIDEKRMDAVCLGQLYQQRMTKSFNKKVKPRQFTSGQLVLKRIFPHQEEGKGKFAPNWQGPYVIHQVLSGGALILEEIDDRVSTKPINSDTIKKY